MADFKECILFLGLETKLMLNSIKPPMKRSTMNQVTNKQVVKLKKSLKSEAKILTAREIFNVF